MNLSYRFALGSYLKSGSYRQGGPMQNGGPQNTRTAAS